MRAKSHIAFAVLAAAFSDMAINLFENGGLTHGIWALAAAVVFAGLTVVLSRSE
ncbi:hypothetical protein [Ancylobacter defluvii]|uniref:hypothetical protein n=1 Tax=Ancylobacter defluvii TaxID=1282440 RepID=UPI001BCED6E6|nr:hypothetical protein [Ancylobacter defluvii]MBS7589486.1 hypothetical protein [Ancylobacter defluvii]